MNTRDANHFQGPGAVGFVRSISNSAARSNFDRWFGGSKVVDEHNQPLKVYHGSGADLGTSVNVGTFFSDQVKVAEIYAKAPTRQTADAGPNLTPVYLSLQNPYVFDAHVINENLSRHVLGKRGRLADVIHSLEAQGFDGIILKNFDDLGGPQDQFVVFKPAQAKSACGNSGAFDPESDSLTDYISISGNDQTGVGSENSRQERMRA